MDNTTKKNNKANKTMLNFVMAWVSQAITIISGIILPRIIIFSFGSEVNGLIASGTQFLSYICLIEGGLGSVYLAALYKPLASNDYEGVSKIVAAGKRYFRQLSLIFSIYAILLAALFPFIAKTSFTYEYVFFMVLILAMNLFIQYCFSIPYKLFLQADHKAYIPLLVQICLTTLNIAITILFVNVYPNIHLIKLCGGVLFLIQPIVFNLYLKKRYFYINFCSKTKEKLPQRWSSFGQSLAFFVHQNTDVTLLTLFSDLKTVSVYSVHSMITNGLKNLIISISQVFSPKIGRAIAEGEKQKIEDELDKYEFISFFISTVFFGTCIPMISSFVAIYTKGVEDVSYFSPLFAILLSLSEYVYCIRNPYISVVYGAGKFKETSISAYLEAAINIAVSLSLIWSLGLVGIAIGTLSAMVFRYIYHIVYIKRHIVFRPVKKAITRLITSLLCVTSSFFVFYFLTSHIITNYFIWALFALACFVTNVSLFLLLNLITDKKRVSSVFRFVFRRKVKEQ